MRLSNFGFLFGCPAYTCKQYLKKNDARMTNLENRLSELKFPHIAGYLQVTIRV